MAKFKMIFGIVNTVTAAMLTWALQTAFSDPEANNWIHN